MGQGEYMIFIYFALLGYCVVFFTVFYAKHLYGKKTATKINNSSTLVKILNYLPFLAITPIYIFNIYEILHFGQPRLLLAPFSENIRYFGILIMFFALFLYSDSIFVMNKNWTVGIELRRGHSVVNQHAYRLIRHPIYTAWYLIIISMFVMFGNWLYLLGLMLVFGWYTYRAGREEAFLCKNLHGYKHYMLHRKRFIPFVY
jgi:protein-S-isoprenylcysteine O-methyltransferase Ste14